VEKFSELLRYQLYDQHQTVPVSQEVRYLKNFIELQEIRSSEKLQLSVHFDARLNGQQVYPLLMLPLVENAFKYVGGDYWITIDAGVENDELCFYVANAIPTEIPAPHPKAGGIGLENLRRRLQLLYPEKHRLRIEKAEKEFRTELKIRL
jgi:LytS/YehU family sensor histidine kinase